MVSQNNETAAMSVSQARWLKTRAAIELWMQRELIGHVCKKVKYGGTLTAETLRDFVWKHFLRLEMF